MSEYNPQSPHTFIHPFLNAISYWWYISKMQYVLGSPSLISLKVKQQRTFLLFLWQWSHGWKSNDYFLLRSLFWELRGKRSKNLLKNYWKIFLFRRCMECRMQKIKGNIRREGWIIFKMGTQKYMLKRSSIFPISHIICKTSKSKNMHLHFWWCMKISEW